MHETGYTKLFSTIVTSTIWQESKDTKILWITMLALANRYGEVAGTIPGIARLAGLTIEETEASLTVLLSPDKYSRSKAHGGRRIETIEGGWKVLNYAVYREKMRKDAAYYREYRQSKRNQMQPSATVCNSTHPIAEAEAEAKAERNKLSMAERAQLLEEFETARKLYPGVKRGMKTEFEDFRRKHKDWREVVPILADAIGLQIQHRAAIPRGEFVPCWKHFRTWLSQRCWEARI